MRNLPVQSAPCLLPSAWRLILRLSRKYSAVSDRLENQMSFESGRNPQSKNPVTAVSSTEHGAYLDNLFFSADDEVVWEQNCFFSDCTICNEEDV